MFCRWIIILIVFLFGICTVIPSPVHLKFRHNVSGKPLILDSLRYLKSGGEIFSVSRLSYLISGLSFQREDGTWTIPNREIIWIDAFKRRDTFLINDLPKSIYKACRFYIGLDESTNKFHPDKYGPKHPLNPALNNLHWSWQGGYIFLALEGHYRKKSKRSGYSFHLARSANRTLINVPMLINHSSPTSIIIDFDLASLLSSPHPLVFNKDGESTHSKKGDPIIDSLKSNLVVSFRVNNIVHEKALGLKNETKRPLYLPENYQPFPFKVARTFPMPNLPIDNPLIQSRVRLGKRLFFDPILSRDESISCASCHEKNKAFTDGFSKSIGISGREGKMNSMPLFNLAWKKKFSWDGRVSSLRDQALMPITNHIEFDNSIETTVHKISNDKIYKSLFSKAFNDDVVTGEKIGLALENYLLTLTSYDSKFDRAMSGKLEMTEIEKRGFELFMTEYEPRLASFGADCFHCHGGALFTDNEFHDNGLKPKKLRNEENRIFSTPSLRNIELTAPYMHDGRFKTLEEVVSHYTSSVHRSETLDPNIAKHPVQGIQLNELDQKAIVAFLKTLTDPKFQGPSPSLNK